MPPLPDSLPLRPDSGPPFRRPPDPPPQAPPVPVDEAAALAHGITAAYLLGHAKAILETPISQLGPDNIYCKKYRVTETRTDAGPKTTVEVEKDSPLSAVQAMAKMIGLDGTRQASQEDKPADEQAEQQALGRALARIIGAGAPRRQNTGDVK
jgi:hypothetical protein